MGMNDYCSALYLVLTVSWCHHPETQSWASPACCCFLHPHKNHSFLTHHSLTLHWACLMDCTKKQTQMELLCCCLHWLSTSVHMWQHFRCLCKNILASINWQRLKWQATKVSVLDWTLEFAEHPAVCSQLADFVPHSCTPAASPSLVTMNVFATTESFHHVLQANLDLCPF